MVSKFGLLDQETILRVMDAYAFVEEHYGLLLTLGGIPQPQFSPARVLWLPPQPIPDLAKMNARWSQAVEEAIAELDAFLARLR